MDLKGCTTVIVAFLLAGSATSYGADFLYTPQPATDTNTEGILVREVTIKRGDTLSHLAKQYTGRGHYYPQILLFNTIKNPHRIHPGQVVRVPLSHRTTAVAETPLTATAPEPTGEPEKHAHKAKRSERKSQDKSRRASSTASTAERKALSTAQAAFAAGDCKRAITLYDRFIARYPASAQIAEATLNRAECYLKLSDD